MIYDYQRLICRRLIAWGALSISAGVYLILLNNPFWRSFGLQAIAWGLVDAVIALFGLRGLSAKINRTADNALAEIQADKLRRILWINAALDIFYIGAGLALVYTLGQSNPMWRGTGWGIASQGAFLFLFDCLHALAIPSEIFMADLGIYDAPEHQPFSFQGSNGWTAVLVHGFPGTPGEMRDLGHDLNARGWTVEGLLLPGFGREYPRMFTQRTAGWIQAIAGVVERCQRSGQKVMLVGFSMGAGLSASAAALVPPERLVLLSPFWFDEGLLIRGLVWLARLFLPVSIRPFVGLPTFEKMLQEGAGKSAPEIDLNSPEIRDFLRHLSIPLVFLEQFREIGFHIKRVYPRVKDPQIPILVTRGKDDPLVRRRTTLRLAQLTRACFVELPGKHHIYVSADPAYPEALRTILEFAQSK